MCGIAGALGSVSPDTVVAMTTALTHRGPDDVGYHLRPGLWLGVRRLSIVDVAGGTQPVYNESGEICVIANAEIYNHRELRARLQARGHRFTSRCDTEVIVHLYEEYGDRCVEHLRGMFAFAIADGGRLLLGRDRLGIKPLYYATVPGGFLFASEIKALLRSGELTPALDLQAFADSRVVGYPVGDRTFIEDVRSVTPGHIKVVTEGPAGPVLADREYYRLPAGHDETITFDEATDRLISVLREIARSHLAADVDVGLILSGGLDSTVLALLAHDEGSSPQSFCVASSPEHPDMIQAARVAGSLGLRHHSLVVGFEDYLGTIPAYIHAAERPAPLGGMGLLSVFQRASREVKTCLNGEGADELFGGYADYLEPEGLGGTLARGLRGLSGAGLSLSDQTLEIIDTVARHESLPAYTERLLSVNMRDHLVQNHLEPIDKCGMAAGLEVRVPYMDHVFAEFVMSLPTEYKVNQGLRIQKHVLKRAALRAWGGDGVIADSILRRKIGAPAAASRYRERLARMIERELPEDYLIGHELGRFFDSKLDLLLHELFCELYLVGRGTAPAELSMRDFIAERAGRALALPA
jgi:asparagine synthase (glutamine-hydrolysing)